MDLFERLIYLNGPHCVKQLRLHSKRALQDRIFNGQHQNWLGFMVWNPTEMVCLLIKHQKCSVLSNLKELHSALLSESHQDKKVGPSTFVCDQVVCFGWGLWNTVLSMYAPPNHKLIVKLV